MADQARTGLGSVVALITGASSGIGYGIAEDLAARGAAVGINFHSDGKAAEQLAARIRGAGGRASAIDADLFKEGDVIRLFDQCVAAFGRVDILVSNAGLQRDAPVAEMSLEDWRAVIDVNLTGQFLCCREAIRRLRTQDDGRMQQGTR